MDTMKKLVAVLLIVIISIPLCGFSLFGAKEVPDSVIEFNLHEYGYYADWTAKHNADSKSHMDTVDITLNYLENYCAITAQVTFVFQYDKSSDLWSLIKTTEVIYTGYDWTPAFDEVNRLKETQDYKSALTVLAGVSKQMDKYSASVEQKNEYKNSFYEVSYLYGLKLQGEGKYQEAIKAFEDAKGFNDSKQQIINCNNALKDIAYEDAIKLLEKQEYDKAIKAFKELGNYKDSEAQLDIAYGKKYGEELYSQVKSINIGDIYVFGRFEQNNDTTDGEEPIEWIVVDKDGVKLMLVSKYALYKMPFNELSWAGDAERGWKNSDIRKWLNRSESFGKAFSKEEWSKLIEVDSYTKVFLLSIDEAETYFGDGAGLTCQPTEYAFSLKTDKYDSNSTFKEEQKDACTWWLRNDGRQKYSNNGSYDIMASTVRTDINYFGSGKTDWCFVRPAVWLDLSK